MHNIPSPQRQKDRSLLRTGKQPVPPSIWNGRKHWLRMKRRSVLGDGTRQSGALPGFFAEEKNLRLLRITAAETARIAEMLVKLQNEKTIICYIVSVVLADLLRVSV